MPFRAIYLLALMYPLAACASQPTVNTVNAPVATEYDSMPEVVQEVARLRPGPFDGRCVNLFVSLLFIAHEAAYFCGQVTEAQGHNWALLEVALSRLVETTGLDPAISRNIQNTQRAAERASSLPDAEHERLCHREDNVNFARAFNVVVAKPMVEAYLSGIESGLAEIAKNGLPADRERPEIWGAL